MQALNTNLLDSLCEDPGLLKALRTSTVRNQAYDHRAVHLLGTLKTYHNSKFSESEINAGAQQINSAKIRRLEHLIQNENMRKPFCSIHASIKETHPGGLSNLFVPSGVKNHKVAAKLCDPTGHVSAAQLIAMAQFDKTVRKLKLN